MLSRWKHPSQRAGGITKKLLGRNAAPMVVRMQMSTTAEKVVRFQLLSPNPSWLTSGRTSGHQNLVSVFQGIDNCLSLGILKQGFGGVARASQASWPRGPAGLKGSTRGPPGRSNRRKPLVRGPNKLFAGGPKIIATPLVSTLCCWKAAVQPMISRWKRTLKYFPGKRRLNSASWWQPRSSLRPSTARTQPATTGASNRSRRPVTWTSHTTLTSTRPLDFSNKKIFNRFV